MKKFTLLIFAICLIFVIGCGKSGVKRAFESFADFNGTKVASQKGTIFAASVDRVASNVEHLLYDTQSDILDAFLTDTADAMCLDMPVARYLVAQNSELIIFPFPVLVDRYGFAVAKESELGVKANNALQALDSRGTLRRLKNIWFSADKDEKTLSDYSSRANFDGSAGKIRYGFEATLVPMSYVSDDGKPTGYEVDVVNRIAYYLNMNIEFIPMIFDDLLPKLAAGEVDMVGGNMSITEERLKTFDFVGPYMEGGVVLVIKRSRAGKWHLSD